MTKTVILDTDPGVDDAMALFYLARHQDVQLHSITTVFGNAAVAVTARNAAYLVERFGLAVPVFAGAGAPLVGARHVPELKVHGSDGFGDTGLADSFLASCDGKPAWQHLADSIEREPGKITIVAIAPLTNLALALRNRPAIADKVAEVIVMGGAFGTKGRNGNIRPNAEANFFYDPQAADEVMAARWPVTVVGLDVTTDCILSSSESAELASQAGEMGSFLHQISRGYEKIYRDFDGIDGFCIHDVAAAVAVTNPGLFSNISAPVIVETVAGAEGHSTFDVSPVGDLASRPKHRICVDVDARKLVDSYIAVMIGDPLARCSKLVAATVPSDPAEPPRRKTI